MDARLTDFLSTLNAVETADEAWKLTDTFMRSLGAHSLVYAAGKTIETVDFYTNTPDWWMERYFEENYALHDVQLHHVISHLHPSFVDIRATETREDISGKSKRSLLEFSEVGPQSLVSLPLRIPNVPQSAGGVTFASELPMNAFQKLMCADGNMIHIALLYAHGMIQSRLHREWMQIKTASLTAREKECLLWLSRGMYSDQIADRLNIARITVDTHIGSAKRKLGAATREHALALAIQLGAITP